MANGNPPNGIDDAKRLDAFWELSKKGFERFHLRRNFEWKINFGFWTTFAIMIDLVYLIKGNR